MATTPGPRMSPKYKSIDEYHASFPAATQSILDEMRKTVSAVVPRAEEVISYNMPAFKLGSVLVYYAAYENHIGFYPTPRPLEHFKDLLKNYKTSKGAVQFPVDKPLPLSLIRKIVKFRASEVLSKSTATKPKQPGSKTTTSTARKKTASR